MALVSRDSFARNELHKQQITVRSGLASCKWCGSTRIVRCSGKADRHVLFEFWVESDGGRRYDISGTFCSVSCMRVYHGK